MNSVTRVEASAYASLVALVVVFGWFQMKMMDGWSIVEQPASALLGVYFTVLVVSTLSEILISAVGARVSGARRIEKDERDFAIEARANQNERLFIIVAVNVLIWQALWEGALEGHALPKIDLTSLPTLFFFLFAVLFGGEIVKRVSTIWLYRTQSARG